VVLICSIARQDCQPKTGRDIVRGQKVDKGSHAGLTRSQSQPAAGSHRYSLSPGPRRARADPNEQIFGALKQDAVDDGIYRRLPVALPHQTAMGAPSTSMWAGPFSWRPLARMNALCIGRGC
jgi:hypothetical protein